MTKAEVNKSRGLLYAKIARRTRGSQGTVTRTCGSRSVETGWIAAAAAAGGGRRGGGGY